MPRVPTRERAGTPIDLNAIGADGLNLNDDPSMLSPSQMRQARNVDRSHGVYARRIPDAKVSKFTDQLASHGSKVFASDTKYAHFVAPTIDVGGFVLMWKFTAVRAADVRWLWDSRQTGGDRVIWSTLDGTNGLYQVYVLWDDATTSTIDVPALPDGSIQHAMLVFDAPAGTLTLYLNGEAQADVITGLSPNLRPCQTNVTPWYVGISYNPATASIASGSGFLGDLDSFVLISTAGIDLTDEDPDAEPPRLSFLDELRKRYKQDWPNPAAPGVLFYFGLDEDTALGSVMYDSSDRKGHGTYVGTPTNKERIAFRAINGNFVGATRRAALGSLTDGRVNVVVMGGQHHYQILRNGA